VEAIAAKAVVGLPTLWRIVTVIGSLASTIILLLGSLAFNMMREEWKELRTEVKEMRHRLDEMPSGATLNRLADDVQDLGRRVDRMETQINNWDE
jgi:Tfp pilus assembly protein PilO